MERRGWSPKWSLLLTTLVQISCLIDEHRCGQNQIEKVESGGFGGCVCAPNAVPSPRGYDCTACGPYQEARGTSCVCQAGFTRDAVLDACVEGSAADAGAEDSASEAGTPTGLGAPCESAADCASFEATFCPPIAPKACIVEGCSAPEVRCPAGFTCCQIPLLMSLARLSSICVPTDMLTSGACPYSGTVVPE